MFWLVMLFLVGAVLTVAKEYVILSLVLASSLLKILGGLFWFRKVRGRAVWIHSINNGSAGFLKV